MKQYVLSIILILPLMPSDLHGMESDDENDIDSMSGIVQARNTPDQLVSAPHTSPSTKKRRLRSLSLSSDDDLSPTPFPLHSSQSLALLPQSNLITPIEYDPSFLDPIKPEKLLQYQQTIASYALDEAEQTRFVHKQRITDAALLGVGCSILLWIRNLNMQNVIKHTTHERFTGLEAPALLMTIKAFLTAGHTMIVPGLFLASATFVWHELKQKILLEQKLKEQKATMDLQEKRISELTTSLQKSDQILHKKDQEYQHYLHGFVKNSHNQLAQLHNILLPLTIHKEKNPTGHCVEMANTIAKQAIPSIQESCRKLQTINNDIDTSVTDMGETRKAWYNPKRWVKDLSHLFNHHNN